MNQDSDLNKYIEALSEIEKNMCQVLKFNQEMPDIPLTACEQLAFPSLDF